MPASTFAANKLLDLLCRGVAWTAPTRVYISLHTADPGSTGASEVSTANWPAYVRKDAANGGSVGTGFAAAASKATSNALEILWPAHNGASSVTVTHYALWDASTSGNCLHSGALTASKTIAPTDEIVLHAGELDITVT